MMYRHTSQASPAQYWGHMTQGKMCCFLSWSLVTIFYAATATGAGGSQWNYQQAGGHGGPDYWPGVCQEGEAQSPIDILTAEHVSLPAWRFSGRVAGFVG